MTHLTNITARKNSLLLAQVVLAAFLLISTVIILRFSDDTLRLSDRLGADIMLVPAGYDPHTDNILLSGRPSATYLPDDALASLQALNIDAIDRITPQVFMATLRASCCAYPVNIMGIDYDSDFIVKSWLDSSSRTPLNDGEIILGHHSTGDVGGEIEFFGKSLRITGRLERTGMGIDSSVFVNMNTLIDLAEAADQIKPQKLAANHNLVSFLMVKLKPGTDAPQTARIINRALNDKDIYALFSKRFVGSISSRLADVSRMTRYFLAALWAVGVIIFLLTYAKTRGEYNA